MEGESAFAQAERIRRTATAEGHQLVAVCQDVRQPGLALGREGYRALLGILAAGQVDGVMIASLHALASDVIAQEVAIWHLRRYGVAVLSATPEDVPELADPPGSDTRRLVRQVLHRVAEYDEATGGRPRVMADEPQVIIELVPEGENATRRSGA